MLQPKIERLAAAFRGMDEYQVATLMQLLKNGDSLDSNTIRSARATLLPLYRLAYLNSKGQPALAGDGSGVAPWIFERVKRSAVRTGVVEIIRPVPPELDPGIMGGYPDQVRPAPLLQAEGDFYLIYAARTPSGNYLASIANTKAIFGPWLTAELTDSGLASNARWSVLPEGETLDLRSHPGTAHIFDRLDSLGAFWGTALDRWRWTLILPSFFEDRLNPTPAIALTVDNGQIIWPVIKLFALLFVGALLVLGSFPMALILAGRGLRRDLEVARAKSNFNAMVSHELKTPVAAICMYAELLENGLFGEQSQAMDYYKIISLEGRRLRRLIDNILELARIERGASTYSVQGTAMNAIAAEAVEIVQALKPGASFELRLAPELPLALADRDAALGAISNVLENACKYGLPPISVATRDEGERVVVEVTDCGPGIPLERRADVFQPYVRLQAEETRSRPGTGLGLALVKSYMEGQQGEVDLGDRPSGGAMFRLKFKRAPG